MNTNSIEVVLSLTSPLHLAYPGNYSKGLSRTITQPVTIEGETRHVPYYPANGFRGGLRRIVADLICDCIKEVEGPVSGELYNGLHCGASSGSPDKNAKSIEEIVRARQHVYMGLFGGGARTHESMYAVSDMLPILDATTRTGMVPPRLRDAYVSQKSSKDGADYYLQPGAIIGERHFVRVDDLYRVSDVEGIVRNVENPMETVLQHQEKVGINKADRQNPEGGDDKAVKEDVANLQAIQAIAAGTPMYFAIDFKSDITEEQIGAILLGLSGLLRENNFGCMGRWGFGRVKCLDITLRRGAESFGKSFGIDEDFALPADLQSYADKAKEVISAIRIADIEEFFKDSSAEKKAAEKKSKADKKAVKAAGATGASE